MITIYKCKNSGTLYREFTFLKRQFNFVARPFESILSLIQIEEESEMGFNASFDGAYHIL